MPQTTQKRRHSTRLGPALRLVRKEAGLTQADLATTAGTARSTVISAEDGAGSYASFEILCRVLPPGDNLGRRLAELRLRRGLSRAAVAKEADIADSTLASIESGLLGTLAPLERVALTLGAGLTLMQVDSKVSVWSGAAVSSIQQTWTTPPSLLRKLYPLVEGTFHLDPCSPRPDGPVRARIRFTEKDDGLSQPWPMGTAFCNPPYGLTIGAWVAKCRQEAEAGATVIALLPSRCGSRWWHNNVAGFADLVMLRGRLSFGKGTTPAPFDSAIAIWNADDELWLGLRTAFPDAWHVSRNRGGLGVVKTQLFGTANCRQPNTITGKTNP
jgi:transcriptional regulator with XRE-family HTH domain